MGRSTIFLICCACLSGLGATRVPAQGSGLGSFGTSAGSSSPASRPIGEPGLGVRVHPGAGAVSGVGFGSGTSRAGWPMSEVGVGAGTTLSVQPAAAGGPGSGEPRSKAESLYWPSVPAPETSTVR